MSGFVNSTGAVSGIIGTTVVQENAQQWKVTSGYTGDTSPVLNWGLCQWGTGDGTSQVGVGTMTESSGIFTFPQTGIWYVSFQASFRTSTAISAAHNYANIHTSNDNGSSYTRDAIAYGVIPSLTDVNISPVASLIMDVGTQAKVYFSTAGNNSSVTVYGHSGSTYTAAMFIRLGDS